MSRQSLPFKLGAWLSALVLVTSAGAAHAATKVACAGEQTTHSAHRENDPEYPLLMGQHLDPGFSDGGKMALYGGGFLEGTGPLFAVGSFAHPQASVLNHDQTNPKTYLKSDEYQQLVAFTPDIVVLGPFGWHDVLSLVPLSQFAGDYDMLIDSVSGISSQPQVALVTPVPQGGTDKADGFTEINGFVKAEAAQRNLPLIDVWTEFLGKSQFYQDDFHLNVDGRTHLAEFIGDSVKELASDPGPQGGGGTAGAAGSGGLGGNSAGQASDAGSTSIAGAAQGGSAGSGGAPPSASGSGGAGPATAGTGTTSNATSSAADSSSCSYSGSKSSPVALGLVLLGLLRRKRRK